jgi:lipopolysaccharide transport system permease protein
MGSGPRGAPVGTEKADTNGGRWDVDAVRTDVGSEEVSTPGSRAPGEMERGPRRLEEPLVAEKKTGVFRLDLKELWEQRELLFFLTWRDVKVRYKQTALGIAWAVLQPVLTMAVFIIFFNRVAGISSGDVPYALFALAGIVLWTFFANSLTNASQSLVVSAGMLTKVYFPRVAIPTAICFGGVVDFVVAFGILLVAMAAYGLVPTAGALVAVPLALAIILLSSLGVGLLLSALNVRFRDVRFVVPLFVQLWLLASPIGYPSTGLEQPWITLYGLNPIAGAVETFRWGLLGSPAPPVAMVAASAFSACLILSVGLLVFGRMEREFADVV